MPFFDEKVSPRDLTLANYDVMAAGDSSQKDKTWKLLLAAYETNPHELPLLRALGYLAQTRGNSAEAMRFYREALELDPIDLTATNNLAALLARSGDLRAAEQFWKKTFALNEDIDDPGINFAATELHAR